MNERTAKQVEAMKAQTFGVEVEMNNITRRTAAQVAATYFGTNRWYHDDASGWHDAWVAVDASGRKWEFSYDGSIHGPSTEKCELGTPVLRYGDMELLQGLIRVLREKGAKSCPSRGCGVHIHIGGDGHTVKTITNLCNLMAKHEQQLIKGIGIASSRMEDYCQIINRSFLRRLNEEKPQSMSALADIWYETNGGNYRRDEHYNSSRYHMLNLHAFFTRYHTIEFRLFQFDEEGNGRKGGLHAGKLKAMVQLCLAMSAQAKLVKFAWVNPQADKTEKSALNHWFYRLGFVGEEFETARKYFSRNAAKSAETATIVPLTQFDGNHYGTVRYGARA